MQRIIGKKVLNIIGATVAGLALVLGVTIAAFPAVSQIAGLAVAQSATLWNSVIDAAKGDAQSTGIMGVSPYVFNGLTFDRVRGTSGSMNVDAVGSVTPADAYTNPTTAIQVWSLSGLFNGTTWNKQDGVSATNNTGTTSVGTAYTTQLSTWRVRDLDVGATQSVATKAAGGTTVRHVATAISACMSATVAQVPLTVNLRDGATGAGTIIRSWTIGIASVNESKCVAESGLNETGTGDTAMTLEFSAAGAATTTTTVNLSGYSTP